MRKLPPTSVDYSGLRRGERVNGGRFVGKTTRSSVWVCYESGDVSFRRMCEAFDRLYSPEARLPRQMAAVA